MKGTSDRMISYCRGEGKALAAVTVSGILYNLGLLAGPWFEGRLAQCLYDVFGGTRDTGDMLTLCMFYVLTIAFVQGMRFIKRFYVRRFANHINRNMKRTLYGSLVHKSAAELEQEDAGSLLTKAISDVDACAEGMRKFATEVFDTGIAVLAYAAMLLWYDWRLALLCMIFPPVAGVLAERMKGPVERAGRAQKESAGRLNAAALDRAAGAVTYRVFGCERQRDAEYEKHLQDYEEKAVRANIRVSAVQPLYQVISIAGAGFILWFGSQNVLGNGWTGWDVGMLTTFLACYAKLAVKASHAAKLFNAVQKAQVSWERIRPLMQQPPEDSGTGRTIPDGKQKDLTPCTLMAEDVSFTWEETSGAEAAAGKKGTASAAKEAERGKEPDSDARFVSAEKESAAGGVRPQPLFAGLSFTAGPGQIIGVTGPVACGKSSFGKLFTGGLPYSGSLRLNGTELRAMSPDVLYSLAVWQGHDSALLSDSVRNNVFLGDTGNVDFWLNAVCMDEEVRKMERGADTPVESGGARLSGGQQARLALARTLAHEKGLIILDDPFAALDRPTEETIFRTLRVLAQNSVVLLISHRLYLFPEMDQVIWIADGRATVGDHVELMRKEPEYAALYRAQTAGVTEGKPCKSGENALMPEKAGGDSEGFDGTSEERSRESEGFACAPEEGSRESKVSARIPAGLLLQAAAQEGTLFAVLLLTVVGAVLFSLLPPLLLERFVNDTAAGQPASWLSAAGYFGLLALAGLAESAREGLLVIFGQKIIHSMRRELCGKLSRLPAAELSGQEPGEVAARFVGDVDTLENLFTSGIISMFADICTIVSIFAVLICKNVGLAALLLVILPLIWFFTRAVQKRMLSAQLASRAASAGASAQVPETIRCIRMIHVLQKEGYMREKYGRSIQAGYDAVEKTNLYDAFYSPVILTVNALTAALVMALSASSAPGLRRFFGMSVGTAVAVISYISQVFSPIESIGMEIQTIQSAVAGMRRMEAFLRLPERWETSEQAGRMALEAAGCMEAGRAGKTRPEAAQPEYVKSGKSQPGSAQEENTQAGETRSGIGARAENFCVEFRNVTFGYDSQEPVLRNLSFSVPQGGQLTLAGRTGAGKSTVFRLLLGEYQAQQGQVLVFGQDAFRLPDDCRRRLFGCVEQQFYRIPGTVLEQITLSDPAITVEQARRAARLAGLDDTIRSLEKGYDTPCVPGLFSQGQWQLLAVARAVATDPPVLLLDEITANLDAATEKRVLDALRRASRSRTVLSISHRRYGAAGQERTLILQKS